MRILFLGDVVGSSGCSKIIDNLFNQIIRNIFDIVFILAILAGAGVGMGVSFPVIAEMTSYLIGIENSFFFQIIILF